MQGEFQRMLDTPRGRGRLRWPTRSPAVPCRRRGSTARSPHLRRRASRRLRRQAPRSARVLRRPRRAARGLAHRARRRTHGGVGGRQRQPRHASRCRVRVRVREEIGQARPARPGQARPGQGQASQPGPTLTQLTRCTAAQRCTAGFVSARRPARLSWCGPPGLRGLLRARLAPPSGAAVVLGDCWLAEGAALWPPPLAPLPPSQTLEAGGGGVGGEAGALRRGRRRAPCGCRRLSRRRGPYLSSYLVPHGNTPRPPLATPRPPLPTPRLHRSTRAYS